MNVQKTLAAALFGAGIFAAGLAQATTDLGTLGSAPTGGSNGYGASTPFADEYKFSIGTLSTVSAWVGEVNFLGLDLLPGWTVDLMDSTHTSLVGGPYAPPGTSASGSWTLGSGDYYVEIAGTTGASGGGYSYSLSAVPVPEPGELALMLSGMGLMGYMVRRRKNGAA
ncbi:MAG: FxDxF family PEP-CTERM protein [Candidatus Nitricoxidivorans perseverans]|uniref:FxDxF family PEP-CTERM protein n=1 Tax=Candidatus Nitricoxidivorans perseverans TaxID=2975601 RepID=A0AA49FMS1_9PROT|nr:MAG: FxDxF family PEP-CTERM protein [Candidatus Nitricoxidivorans perseverans]